MRITYWGVFESDYPRNRIFINGLQEDKEVEMLVLHRPVFEKTKHKTGNFLSFFSLILLVIKLKIAYIGLTIDYFKNRKKTDIWVCGYIGQLDILVLSFLKKISRDKKPILFNPLLSIYDTLVTDRGKYSESGFISKMIRKIDRLAFAAADHIIMDTKAHRIYIIEEFDVPEEKISTIWVGAETAFFRPKSKLPKTGDRKFIVQFIGKFIPLHGIDVILEAAKWFNKDEVIFEIIGSGQLDDWFEGAIKERNLENIVRIPWVTYEDLPQKMRESHISLGVFNTSAKSQRVIPNKVFQALALGRITITAQSEGIAELQAKGIPIVAVKPGSGPDLARLIQQIKDGYDDMHGFALQAKKLSRDYFAPSILVNQFKVLCRLLIDGQEIPIPKADKLEHYTKKEVKTTEMIWEELDAQKKLDEQKAKEERAKSTAEKVVDTPAVDDDTSSENIELQESETGTGEKEKSKPLPVEDIEEELEYMNIDKAEALAALTATEKIASPEIQGTLKVEDEKESVKKTPDKKKTEDKKITTKKTPDKKKTEDRKVTAKKATVKKKTTVAKTKKNEPANAEVTSPAKKGPAKKAPTKKSAESNPSSGKTKTVNPAKPKTAAKNTPPKKKKS